VLVTPKSENRQNPQGEVNPAEAVPAAPDPSETKPVGADSNREEAGTAGITVSEPAGTPVEQAGHQEGNSQEHAGHDASHLSSPTELPLPTAENSGTQSGERQPEPGEPSRAVSAEKSVSTKDLDALVLANSRRRTRRSFAVAAVAAAAGYRLYNWTESGPREQMQPEPFRRAFQLNAAIARRVFEERALAPTYPLSRAENLRVNGVYGLHMTLYPESYRLQVVGVRDARGHPRYASDVTAWEYRYMDAKTAESLGYDTKTPPLSARTAEKMSPEEMMEEEKRREMRTGRMPRGREEAGQSRSTLPQPTSGLLLTMADILRLPRYELVTQFKCIEGWSQIVHWAGVRMADFLEEYPPEFVDGEDPRFVYMETPDGDYYTGYDLKVCRHPQTLLVTEMMGAPLTQFHGAPLRLHMPTKYGYKQIKRIGLISYTNERPDDYWTKLGYDWYAGL
jgi:hypothetical protein